MIGRYAKIVKDPIAPILKGFAGKITRTKEYNGRIFYEIVSENYGPKIPGTNYLSWQRGTHRAVVKENLEIIGD